MGVELAVGVRPGGHERHRLILGRSRGRRYLFIKFTRYVFFPPRFGKRREVNEVILDFSTTIWRYIVGTRG